MSDSKESEREHRRIRTPGCSLGSSTSFEQIRPGMFALHEQMPAGSWRITEAAEVPDPSGSGVFVPMQRLLWPGFGTPVDYENDKVLFGDVVKFYEHHESLREDKAYDILATWTFMTYRQNEFSILPYLDILGPKGTGKTRLDELLAAVCYRGWLVTHPSPASVFYMVDRYQPTLICDNYEFWGKETRGNSTAYYARVIVAVLLFQGNRKMRAEPTS